ncbi:MAG: L-fucose/L-arabinose isomerase family protein [Candidatus Poribacteria bacterium]
MKSCIAVIIGNRGVFPGYLSEGAREDIMKVFEELDIEPIIIPKEETKFGAIENLEEAKKCAELFRKNKEKIDGILVTLPNFGDERAVADTIRMSELNVPVLIQAYPDELDKLDIGRRRDSFCGKLSVCSNLDQYGIPFSLTNLHTVSPMSDNFINDLKWFLGVCRVVKGLKGAKIGSIGARTTPFKTVRFSEKILEINGISVETVDLSEIIGKAERIKDSDKQVKAKLKAINAYAPTADVPSTAIVKMAKFAIALEEWIKTNNIKASALRCWPELQEYADFMPCYLMSMLSESLSPCACEVDVMGAIAMYALQLASEMPAGLFDWNNNYGDDPDKLILFHCSNYPKSMLQDPKMSYNDIDANVRGTVEKSYGTCVGRLRKSPITFARIATNDVAGTIIAYIGEGELTDDPLNTFGGVGVAYIERLQSLLRFMCKNGFEHHVAISQSRVADILFEAMETYLGWNVYYHS